MADYPYIAQFTAISLAANGAITLSFQAPTNENYDFKELRYFSTGIFSINQIYDSSGFVYGNLSATNYLHSNALQNGNSSNIGLQVFFVPLHLMGGVILKIDVQDQSAATNTIRFYLSGVRHLG